MKRPKRKNTKLLPNICQEVKKLKDLKLVKQHFYTFYNVNVDGKTYDKNHVKKDFVKKDFKKKDFVKKEHLNKEEKDGKKEGKDGQPILNRR